MKVWMFTAEMVRALEGARHDLPPVNEWGQASCLDCGELLQMPDPGMRSAVFRKSCDKGRPGPVEKGHFVGTVDAGRDSGGFFPAVRTDRFLTVSDVTTGQDAPLDRVYEDKWRRI